MKAYDNRITEADVKRRREKRPLTAGVQVVLNDNYSGYYLLIRTLALDDTTNPSDVFIVRKSGRVILGHRPESYMPIEAPGARTSLSETLSLDIDRVLARYRAWEKRRFLEQFENRAEGEQQWKEIERKREAHLR